jgi:hypothetical protein
MKIYIAQLWLLEAIQERLQRKAKVAKFSDSLELKRKYIPN